MTLLDETSASKTITGKLYDPGIARMKIIQKLLKGLIASRPKSLLGLILLNYGDVQFKNSERQSAKQPWRAATTFVRKRLDYDEQLPKWEEKLSSIRLRMVVRTRVLRIQSKLYAWPTVEAPKRRRATLSLLPA